MGNFDYKNIAFRKNTGSYGASIAVGANYLPVISWDVNKDPSPEMVEHTTNTTKGLKRSVNVRDVIEGSASFHVDYLSIGYWLGLAWNGGVSTVSVGTSATDYVFGQNTDGNVIDGRFDVNKEPDIDGYNGSFVRSFEITASDNVVESTVELTTKTQFDGASFTPTTNETRVITFANATWYYGDTLGTAGATIDIPVTDWTLNYTNNAVAKFEGSNTITRVDFDSPPTLEFTLSRFFDGNSAGKVFKDNVFTEDQERGFRLVLESDSDDTIEGSTPYKLEFPMPKVKAMTSNRPYQHGEVGVEECSGSGEVDETSGYMCEPILTTINDESY